MKLLIFFCILLLGHSAFSGPFGFKRGKIDLYTEASYLKTTRNHNDTGQLYALNGTNHLQEIGFNVGGSYDFGAYWGVRTDINFKQVAAFSNQGYFYSNTTTGLSDFSLGMDFFVLDFYGFKFIPDVSLFVPLSGAPGETPEAFLNDGAMTVTGKLYVSRDFWILKNSFYGGYQWRGAGYSGQIPLGLIVRAQLSRFFFLDLKGFGEISLNNDQYTTTASTRNIKSAQYNGGSFLYGSVNPSFFALKAGLGWNISSSWSLSAGIKQTVSGMRIADETRLYALLKFTGFVASGRSQPKFESDDKFEVDTEE